MILAVNSLYHYPVRYYVETGPGFDAMKRQYYANGVVVCSVQFGTLCTAPAVQHVAAEDTDSCCSVVQLQK
jgi:hypothetical protein